MQVRRAPAQGASPPKLLQDEEVAPFKVRRRAKTLQASRLRALIKSAGSVLSGQEGDR